VRELKNCITRATAFAEGEVLYAEDLVFDDASVSPISLFGDSRPLPAQLVFERNAQAAEPGPRREAETQEQQPAAPKPAALRRSDAPAEPEPDQGGNVRQQVALRLARERGSFTRLDYQKAVGAGISQRTAQYDLQLLVRQGLLRKSGKGPATQYLLA